MTLLVTLGPHRNSDDNAIIHIESGENILQTGKVGSITGIHVTSSGESEITTVSADLWVQRVEVTPGRFEVRTFHGNTNSDSKPIAKILFEDGTEWDIGKEIRDLMRKDDR